MKTRIAIIEDNPESLELMIYLLNFFGYETLTAMDGIEGLSLVRNEKPDLIICDIQLPGMNGIQICKTLKSNEAFAQIPIVAVTADSMVRNKERMINAGFNGYIPKPIDAEYFVQEIEQYLIKNKRVVTDNTITRKDVTNNNVENTDEG